MLHYLKSWHLSQQINKFLTLSHLSAWLCAPWKLCTGIYNQKAFSHKLYATKDTKVKSPCESLCKTGLLIFLLRAVCDLWPTRSQSILCVGLQFPNRMMLYNNKFRFLIATFTTFSYRQCVMCKPQKSNFVACQKPVRGRRSFWHRIQRDHDEGCLLASGVKAKMQHSKCPIMLNFLILLCTV